MRATSLGLLATVLALSAGCTGGVSTAGDTPEEAAMEVADEICNRSSTCGRVSVDCTSDGTTTTCTGELGDPPTAAERMECYDDLSMGLVTAFTQADAAGIAREDIDACVNATVSQSCVTQAELDAYIARVEAGEMDAEIREAPPECAALGIAFGP